MSGGMSSATAQGRQGGWSPEDMALSNRAWRERASGVGAEPRVSDEARGMRY